VRRSDVTRQNVSSQSHLRTSLTLTHFPPCTLTDRLLGFQGVAPRARTAIAHIVTSLTPHTPSSMHAFLLTGCWASRASRRWQRSREQEWRLSTQSLLSPSPTLFYACTLTDRLLGFQGVAPLAKISRARMAIVHTVPWLEYMPWIVSSSSCKR
jgi:hypothetical protein